MKERSGGNPRGARVTRRSRQHMQVEPGRFKLWNPHLATISLILTSYYNCEFLVAGKDFSLNTVSSLPLPIQFKRTVSCVRNYTCLLTALIYSSQMPPSF